ncbi:phage portal protein [Glycomyces lechevalierae]|uniref:Phage portal protein n=2 Tax=Actinomycetes TaxID=1760 RepID=A0ABU2AHY8_9ACTN|nr:phage portal protein [Glycomyces lechevalierae]MDR7336829.1 hypothetical protein [Glycomyces lechevalierae]
MSFLDEIADRRKAIAVRDRKAFTLPPSWADDASRAPMLSSYSLQGNEEQIENDFEAYIRYCFKGNGIVWSLMAARQMVMSEARFQWRRFKDGRPQELFGSDALALLERPWPGGTTSNLIARMDQDACLAGNCYLTTADDSGRIGRASRRGRGRRIVRMRPDWTTIVITAPSGNPWGLDAKVGGYLYEPRPLVHSVAGVVDPPTAGATLLMPDEVAHFSPHPDPEARFRGMSPITPVVREIQADTQSTIHKQAFLKNAATPNLVVKFDRETSEDAFDEFVKQFRSSHQGSRNAYKTLFLTGGADVEAVGVDFKQLDFAATVGKGESRLASAFGVPPSWVGFSEALAGSSLNAGNFTAARDRFADGTVRPWWRDAAASLEVLIERPDDGASLWYDDRDIAFLRKDEAEQAKIHAAEAQTIRTLIDAGMTATSVVDAVNAQDWSLLEHSGLYSVQLQPANQQPTQPATGNSPEESGEETED